jgi:uncharacterized membrane protein
MFGSECFDFSFWWIFPVVMIALCFFMMRGRMGMMMCGSSSHINVSDSPTDILKKRYVLNEISREEYEERKRDLKNLN